MKIKSRLAIISGRASQWLLKTFFKGGSSYPGKLALTLDPHILDQLAKDYEIVVITGTNGKTLTTALTVNVLQQEFEHVLTNPTGANMIQGIVSTFLSARPKKGQKKFAVLEIDEASLSHVTKYIQPKLFVFTNIFRDQMDRYGEIYTTYQMILDGAKAAPNALILANGDSPLFHSIPPVNPQQYFGFDHLPDKEQRAHYNTDGVLCPKCHHILHYHMITYANLGKYYCPNCGFQRPTLDTAVTEITHMDESSSAFVVDQVPYQISIGGLYNIYNALAAIAVAKHYQVAPERIQAGLQAGEKVFGRQETFSIEQKKCTLILVKNPAGLNQVIDLLALSDAPFSLVSLLNANYADGIDISWIWDGHYEAFSTMEIPAVITGGERVSDMTLRLKVAGIPEEKIQEHSDLTQVVQAIKQAPTEKVYILATYTAMLQFRKLLDTQGYLQGGNHGS